MQITQIIVIFIALATSSMAFPGYHGVENNHVDYYAYPKYNFDYGVQDHKTGDMKNQWESRDGDVVKGSYSLHEADGTIRQVDYTADKHNGFNAVVKRLGKAVHPHVVQHHGEHFGGAVGGYYGGAASFSNGNNIALAHHGVHHY